MKSFRCVVLVFSMSVASLMLGQVNSVDGVTGDILLNGPTPFGVIVKPDSGNSVATEIGTSDTTASAIIRNSSGLQLFGVRGDGRIALGGTPGDLGLYPMQVTVTGPTWTFLRLKGAGSPALAGIVYDRSTSGFYSGLNNSGQFRLAPMSTVDQTGMSAAKDTGLGLTMDTAANITIGPPPAATTGFSFYKFPLTVTGPEWSYVRIQGSGNPLQTGIVFDRGNNTGFLMAFTGDGSFRIAPMASMNDAGLTAAKDGVNGQDVGLTMEPDGDIRVAGNIGAKYQDVAEWVPVHSQLEPGTVVVLDRVGRNVVLASSSAYDTAVAGVVSARPGIILGDAGTDKAQVATTGRVRVKVDASNASIAAGDLLVTSGRSGYAMKSIPLDVAGAAMHRPGTIVGKALEPLDKGTGEILVLLSLQ